MLFTHFVLFDATAIPVAVFKNLDGKGKVALLLSLLFKALFLQTPL
jgi:hypothetical protein